MSNAGRRHRRAKRSGVTKKERGACCVKDCGRNGSIGQSCELCAKKGKEFKVLGCPGHAGVARDRLKRHILVRHPGALPAWMAAALSGRDMR